MPDDNRKTDIQILILSFFAGGTLGGLWETVWTFFVHGSLQWKSGVMFFPLCNPIYGTGALLITLYSMKEQSRIRRYLFSFLACTAAEFFFSYAEELVFGTVSWDYSSHFLNIQGRVNLVYSLFWGLLGLLWGSYALPPLASFVRREREKSESVILVLVPLYVTLLVLSLAGMYFITDTPSNCNGVIECFFTPDLMDFFYPTRIIAP